jgi:hypothetical protein
MKAALASLLVSLVGLSAACSKLADSVDPNSDGGGNSNAGKGSSHAGTGSGGHSGSSSGMGGASSRAGNAGATGKAGESGGGVLSLAHVDANVVGRDGDAVRFTVTGTQPASKVSSIAVSFKDANGGPIGVFDAAFDGSYASADGRVVFDAPIVDDSFTAVATLTGVKNASKLATVQVVLVDGADNVSQAVDTDVVQQKLPKTGEACDPTYVENRCGAGESCSGSPTLCTAGVAPVIVELKYYHATNGPVTIARGTDPDDDMGSLHIEFLDTADKPVMPDSMLQYTSLDTPVRNQSDQGVFYIMNKSAMTFDSLVPRLRVTPVDSVGHEGAPVVANLGNQTRAADGLTCDARGFIGCADTSVCTPGLPVIVGNCVKLKTAHQTACKDALVLDPAKGVISASGKIDGSSLWDPPMGVGCTNSENIERPEGVVRLHLASVANKLTITSKRPETTVDTVLYLLPGCPDDSKAALGCNDDAPSGGYASELALSKVPAGDYTIVVESVDVTGGAFGVSISVE